MNKAHAGLLAGQNEALELALLGMDLPLVLDALTRTVEVHSRTGALAAIQLPDADGRLHHVSRGSVPAPVCEAVDALPPDIGLGALALQQERPMSLEDPAVEPVRSALGRLLDMYRLHTCWAVPILSAAGPAQGVFLLYTGDVRGLADEDRLAVQSLLPTAALAIEQDRRRRARLDEERQQAKTLAALAHDLRNPLAPLRTALEVIIRTKGEPAATERASAIMTRQISLLAELTDELSRMAHLHDAADEHACDQLPLASPAEPAISHPLRAPDTPMRRVLIADDNELVRESFVDLLAAEGFEVRTAVDGVQAVEIADQWQPDVVLLDIHMPRLSGIETARRLRATHPPGAMKLMMLSGMSLNDAWVRHAKAAGFDDCLDKTSDPQTWLPRLRAPAAAR